MELFDKYKDHSNRYCEKIKDSRFLQGNQVIHKDNNKDTNKDTNQTIHKEKNFKVKDICEIIISQNELEYQVLETSHRNNFTKQKKLELVPLFETLQEKFHKKFSKKVIQDGLQSENKYSSILYMNEIYKINVVIYNQDSHKYYKTGLNSYSPLYVSYKKGHWIIPDIDDNTEKEYGNINELSTILTMDYKSPMIYKIDLLPISKYKVADLESLAIEKKIETMIHQKKKTKQRLYDDLMVYYSMNQSK